MKKKAKEGFGLPLSISQSDSFDDGMKEKIIGFDHEETYEIIDCFL